MDFINRFTCAFVPVRHGRAVQWKVLDRTVPANSYRAVVAMGVARDRSSAITPAAQAWHRLTDHAIRSAI